MNMVRIFTDDLKLGTYIALPLEKALLYLEFERDGFFRIKQEPEFAIDLLVKNKIEIKGYFKNRYVGEKGGKALFMIAPLFYRGTINPDAVQRHSKGLEEQLRDEVNIDISSEEVKTIALEILGRLPQKQRENPYVIVEEIIGWIKDNIESSLVPDYIVDNVKKAIEMLPGEQPYDPFTILTHSFNIKPAYLKKVASQVHLPINEKDPRKLAIELMNQAGKAGRFFQLFWWKENSTSASTTIKSRAGKCVGISNTYVALARALGIPSKKLKGYATDGSFGGHHAWASSYLHPYGWVEVDPTFREFMDFNYDTHLYELSYDTVELPDFTMIENGNTSESKVKGALKFLLEDKSRKIDYAKKKLRWWDKSFNTRKLQRTMGLEDSLYRDELEYLKRVQESPVHKSS